MDRPATLARMELWLNHLLQWLALPEFGLSTVFVVSFISATLLPLGSEPAVFGLVKLNPDLFWWAIAVATTGNTLGGAIRPSMSGPWPGWKNWGPRLACSAGYRAWATPCVPWPAGCKCPYGHVRFTWPWASSHAT
jgi:hypothetical protein